MPKTRYRKRTRCYGAALAAPVALFVGGSSFPILSYAFDRSSIVGQASVIDGDTIEIHGHRIRLFGIDAPEGRQRCKDASGTPYRCGQRSALALSDKIGRRTVACDPRDVDRYRRVVAVCRVNSIDLNAWLVAEALAVAFRRYSRDYVPQEDQARRARRGMWAGSFMQPSDWRRAQRR